MSLAPTDIVILRESERVQTSTRDLRPNPPEVYVIGWMSLILYRRQPRVRVVTLVFRERKTQELLFPIKEHPYYLGRDLDRARDEFLWWCKAHRLNPNPKAKEATA